MNIYNRLEEVYVCGALGTRTSHLFSLSRDRGLKTPFQFRIETTYRTILNVRWNTVFLCTLNKQETYFGLSITSTNEVNGTFQFCLIHTVFHDNSEERTSHNKQSFCICIMYRRTFIFSQRKDRNVRELFYGHYT